MSKGISFEMEYSEGIQAGNSVTNSPWIRGWSVAQNRRQDKLHFFDFDNAKMLYKGDWNAYKKSRPHDNDCSIAESDNWKGAQQCVESWECRGARMCERGGWCSGYDGCEGSPLPTQAPGLSATH